MADAEPEFDEYAEHYGAALDQGISISGEDKDFFARGRLAWLRDRLAPFKFQPRTILDYGCGTGSAIPFLRDLFQPARIHGVDVSARSLELARKSNPGGGVTLAHVAEAQPPAEFDLAFCNGVFHHIPLDQRGPAMDYIYRALRPGGFFALWENNPWNPGARLVMHRIPFDRHAIMLWPVDTRRRMRDAGFEIAGTNFLFIFPSALRFLRGLEPALCRLPLGAQYMVLGRKLS